MQSPRAVDALKAKTATIDAKASLDKKVNAKKAQLKSAQQSMAGVKMKSMVRLDGAWKPCNRSQRLTRVPAQVFHIVVLVAVLNVLSSMYDGLIVAELPFTPWGFFQSMTKRYLPVRRAHRRFTASSRALANSTHRTHSVAPTQPDTRDTACSMMFIYVVTSFGVRPSLQKALGTAQPKGSAPSMFDIPEQEQMRR